MQRWKGNIKMRAVVNTVMNLWVSSNSTVDAKEVEFIGVHDNVRVYKVLNYYSFV
jgi:hypothetical protein